MGRYSHFLEIVRVVLVVFLLAVAIRYFVFQPFQVEGSSMEPDFHSGEYLLIEKFTYRFHYPRRGDVIVFRYPNNHTIDYIKRIVGLPGETIAIQEGRVLIDGKPLSEPYLAADEKTYVNNDPEKNYQLTLESDQYFVMGDNRSHSSDSREWGQLDRKHFIGRSTLALYPSPQLKPNQPAY